MRITALVTKGTDKVKLLTQRLMTARTSKDKEQQTNIPKTETNLVPAIWSTVGH